MLHSFFSFFVDVRHSPLFLRGECLTPAQSSLPTCMHFSLGVCPCPVFAMGWASYTHLFHPLIFSKNKAGKPGFEFLEVSVLRFPVNSQLSSPCTLRSPLALDRPGTFAWAPCPTPGPTRPLLFTTSTKGYTLWEPSSERSHPGSPGGPGVGWSRELQNWYLGHVWKVARHSPLPRTKWLSVVLARNQVMGKSFSEYSLG